MVRKIKRALESRKVLVLPTDTVYGLVCDSKDEQAVKKIFDIKKRPLNKSIGIFVKDIEMAKRVAQITKEQERLLRKKWPGKITFILKKIQSDNRCRSELISGLIGTKETIGVRIPDCKSIRQLFEKIDFALAQTSANISGRPATTKISEVLKQFEGRKIQPDLIIDAGNLPESESSTVIDLTTKKPQVLR